MSVSSEDDSSHRSGGDSYSDSDGEGSATASLPATQKRPHKIQIKGASWILRGDVTTNLLHNDSSYDISMDGDGRDADDDAKIQHTKSQIEAALGTKFESLLGKCCPSSNISCSSCSAILSHHACWGCSYKQDPTQGFPELSSKWENAQH